MKVYNWLKEIIKRVFQIFTGIFIFDMPGIRVMRNLIIRRLICKDGFGGVIISSHVLFYTPHGLTMEKVILGNRVRISENVKNDCSSPLSIEGNVWISEDVSILKHEYVIDAREWKQSKNVKKNKGIDIGRRLLDRSGNIILPQVNFIGKGAIVGAGSVVTRNVEPYTIVAGNPASKIGER